MMRMLLEVFSLPTWNGNPLLRNSVVFCSYNLIIRKIGFILRSFLLDLLFFLPILF